MNRVIVLLFCGIFFFTVQGYSQDQYPKNSIYFSGGYIDYDYQYAIAYERQLLKKNKFGVAAKVSVGNYIAGTTDFGGSFIDYYSSFSSVISYGMLELDLGISIPIYEDKGAVYGTSSSSSKRPVIQPDLDLAIRVPIKKYFIRVGLGFPELIFACVGYNF